MKSPARVAVNRVIAANRVRSIGQLGRDHTDGFHATGIVDDGRQLAIVADDNVIARCFPVTLSPCSPPMIRSSPSSPVIVSTPPLTSVVSVLSMLATFPNDRKSTVSRRTVIPHDQVMTG